MPISHERYAAPLSIELRPSRALAAAGIALHLLALVAAAHTALPASLRIALYALVLGTAWYSASWWRLYVRLEWLADGRWRLHTRHGRVLEAGLDGNSIVVPAGAWLVFRRSPGGEHCLVVVARDACDAQALRRLRVRLACRRARHPGR